MKTNLIDELKRQYQKILDQLPEKLKDPSTDKSERFYSELSPYPDSKPINKILIQHLSDIQKDRKYQSSIKLFSNMIMEELFIMDCFANVNSDQFQKSLSFISESYLDKSFKKGNFFLKNKSQNIIIKQVIDTGDHSEGYKQYFEDRDTVLKAFLIIYSFYYSKHSDMIEDSIDVLIKKSISTERIDQIKKDVTQLLIATSISVTIIFVRTYKIHISLKNKNIWDPLTLITDSNLYQFLDEIIVNIQTYFNQKVNFGAASLLEQFVSSRDNILFQVINQIRNITKSDDDNLLIIDYIGSEIILFKQLFRQWTEVKDKVESLDDEYRISTLRLIKDYNQSRNLGSRHHITSIIKNKSTIGFDLLNVNFPSNIKFHNGDHSNSVSLHDDILRISKYEHIIILNSENSCYLDYVNFYYQMDEYFLLRDEIRSIINLPSHFHKIDEKMNTLSCSKLLSIKAQTLPYLSLCINSYSTANIDNNISTSFDIVNKLFSNKRDMTVDSNHLNGENLFSSREITTIRLNATLDKSLDHYKINSIDPFDLLITTNHLNIDSKPSHNRDNRYLSIIKLMNNYLIIDRIKSFNLISNITGDILSIKLYYQDHISFFQHVSKITNDFPSLHISLTH